MTGVRQRLSGLSERWKSLRPTTRRVLTLGAVFVLGGLLFMVGMPDRKPRTLGKSSGDAYEFHNPDLAAEVLTESLQAKIAVQSSQIAEMNRRMEQLEQERRRTNASTPKPQAPAPASVDKTILMDEIGKMLPSSPIVPSSEPLFIAPPSALPISFRPCWYIFFEREKRGSLDTAQRSGTDRRERPCPTRATKSGSAFLDADADAGGGSGRHGPLQGQIRDGRNYGKKG